LVAFGPVQVKSLGDDQVSSVPCRKVRLEGKDFAVLAWFSRADGHVVRAESSRPDSHDWTSFKLQLVRSEEMDPFRWQAFRREVLSKFIADPAATRPRAEDAGSR